MKQAAKTAYYGDWLYLPHGVLNGASIKAALSFPVRSQGRVVGVIRAYKEDDDYLAVPREFYTALQLKAVGIQIEDQVPKFEHVEFEDRITLRDEAQHEAFRKLKAAGGGTLCLACGLGKSVVALKYIAHLGVPAVIVVHTADLFRQWKNEIAKFLNFSDLGIIQGPMDDWQWEKPITLAMLQTLSGKASEIQGKIRRFYGIVVIDECQHISAPFFSQSAPLFFGNRLGLSATPEREDGLHPLFLAHLGPVFHTYLQQPLTPEVFFVNVMPELTWPQAHSAAIDKGGELNYSLLWQVMARDEKVILKTMELIAQCICEARKVLVICRTHASIYRLAEETERLAPGDVGIITGKEKGPAREEALRTKSIIFGVSQLAREGLDRPDLDTLVMLEPIKAKGALQQTIGRILRDVSKKSPRIYILRVGYPPVWGMCNSMCKHLREWGYPFSALKEESRRQFYTTKQGER